MRRMKIVVRQAYMCAGRPVQRMRNILVILALLVCTSICLGHPGQTITINRDIGEWKVAWKWEVWRNPVKNMLRVQELKYLDIAGNGNPALGSDDYGKALAADAAAADARAVAADARAVAAAALAYNTSANAIGFYNADTDASHDAAAADDAAAAADDAARAAAVHIVAAADADARTTVTRAVTRAVAADAHAATDVTDAAYVAYDVRTAAAAARIAADAAARAADAADDADVAAAAAAARTAADIARAAADAARAAVVAHTTIHDARAAADAARIAAAHARAAARTVAARGDTAAARAYAAAADTADARAVAADALAASARAAADAAHSASARAADAVRTADKAAADVAAADDARHNLWKDPNNNRLIIKPGAKVGNAYGAKMNKTSVSKNAAFRSMTNNEVIVNGGEFGCGSTGGNIAGAFADSTIVGDMNVSSNTVRITRGSNIKNVYGGRALKGTVSSNTVEIERGIDIEGDVFGGYIIQNGTATGNAVNLTRETVKGGIFGAKIGNEAIHRRFRGNGFGNGLASSNTVTIIGVRASNVHGGYIFGNGTATLNEVHLTSVTSLLGNIYGARIGSGYASSNTVTITSGTFGGNIYGAWIGSGYASSNTVTITSGTFDGDVYGGYIDQKGTATGNKVNLTSVTVVGNVFGERIGSGYVSSNTVTVTGGIIVVKDEEEGEKETDRKGNVYGGYIEQNGTATLNTVNLTSVIVSSNVHGGYIDQNGTAILNTVNLTSVTVGGDVFGAKVGHDRYTTYYDYKKQYNDMSEPVFLQYIKERDRDRSGSGLASSNTVTITGGRIGGNVYGGYVEENGTANGNTVTINDGKIEGAKFQGKLRAKFRAKLGAKPQGNVFGGYVGGNGEAIYNTITITGVTEFSTTTILCGGICANTATNNAFTGNTLNIETKGVVVKGISNFENYKFHLKGIKSGETILTATSGGCSWDVGKFKYTTACKVDLSRSNIHLHTQVVLNKGDYYTLIKSPRGFENNISCKQFDFDNVGLVKYYWKIGVVDNGQNLIAKLTDKRITDEGVAKSLSEGYGAGIVCTNNGMDFVLSKMEETESLLGKRKGEIGAFCGLSANKSKSSYNTGSHIDMTGMSMMGGVGIRVEVGEKKLSFKGQSPKEQSPKEQSSKELSSELTVGVFGEYGTGNSDIDSGLCPCEKKSEGKSNYVGGGLLGRYSICKDEFSGTKGYVEAILRAGQVKNSFNIKGAKDSTGKEYGYADEPTMYGGCALGGGYKHKVSEKIDLDWSLRYMFGYQDGKDVERADADGNGMKFESVTSNRIRVGVRGTYVELEKVKPYIGIGYEHELSGKIKGVVRNGVDSVGDISASSFGGGTGIVEVGANWKVWKLGVDISGQGYLGVRKGFGGMLKLKYTFGKDAHAKPQPKDKKKGNSRA